jgi:protocatechuate 3,4-dioxygenase beta subunit
MRRLIVLWFMGLRLWAQAQPAVDPSTLGHLEGRVLNATTGEPLRKANITLHNGPSDYSAITDGTGHFVIERIQPGSYNLTAEHQNFAVMQYGATRTGMPGRPISLTAGQSVTDIEIKLVPFGVISGKIVDSDGDPVTGVPVSVMRWGFARGGRQLMPSGGGGSTNDRGEYRIYNLQAGRYYVMARPIQSENLTMRREFLRGTAEHVEAATGRESYAPTFYPNAPDAGSASAVVLTAGQEAPGTDIQLRKSRMYTVQGRVSGIQKGRRYMVSMQPSDAASSGNFGGKAGVVRPEDGSFLFRGVTPGRYVLIASVDNRVAARQDVAIGDGDLDGLVIALGEPGTIKGRILIDPSGGTTTGSVQGLRISLNPLDNIPMNVPNAGSGPDGSFVMEEVSADRYRLNCSPIGGTYLKTIRWNGQISNDGVLDMSGGGSATLDLVFSATSAQLEGDVKTADDQPSSGTTVLLMPLTGHDSDFRVMISDSNGHFVAKAIAPGSYAVMATDAQMFSMPDAAFLKSIEKLTTAVNVDENGHATAALKVVPESAIEATQ